MSANIMAQGDRDVSGLRCRVTVDDEVRDDRASTDTVKPFIYCLVKSVVSNSHSKPHRPFIGHMVRIFSLPIVLFWVLVVVALGTLVPSLDEVAEARPGAAESRRIPPSYQGDAEHRQGVPAVRLRLLGDGRSGERRYGATRGARRHEPQTARLRDHLAQARRYRATRRTGGQSLQQLRSEKSRRPPRRWGYAAPNPDRNTFMLPSKADRLF